MTQCVSESKCVCVCVQYLAVSQDSDDRESQCFHMLLKSTSHGCSQLLQDGQRLLNLLNEHTNTLWSEKTTLSQRKSQKVKIL